VIATPWQNRHRLASNEARHSSLRAIAALGQLAIQSRDLPTVLHEAARLAARCLGANSAILQITSSGNRVLRANVDWNDAHESLDDSALQVEIGGRDRTWGLLVVRAQHARSFDGDDAAFLQSIANAVSFVIERAHEEHFAKMFQASPVALAITTLAEGRIIDVNESWLEMFGFRRDEVIGNTTTGLALGLGASVRAESVNEFRSHGRLRNRELQAKHKSGEVLDLIVSAVSVPLMGEEETWLSAQIDVTDRRRAEAERDQLLEREQAARAAAESALERLRAIESITDSALRNLDLDELLQELLARVRGALNADYASVALVDARREELYLRAVSGHTLPHVLSIRTPLGQGVSGMIAADGQPRIVHDLSTIDLSHISGATADEIKAYSRSVVGAPLQGSGKIIGVVTAASPEMHHFNDEDLKLLLVVADRVAPAIERARLIETIHAAQKRLKALSTRLLTAQEEERRHIAVELHDELGQVLTAVKIKLQTVERKLDVESRAGIADAIDSVDEAMERVRNLALDLRPAILDDLGLPMALRWYTHRFARDTGIEVHFSADDAPRLEPVLETACFRVAQEALTNVMRHAHARHVWIELQLGSAETGLNIRDDGIGFDVPAARERAIGGVSVGLLGMEERVSSLGGEFAMQSARGKGTRLSIRFPASEGLA
jgi:PAS domain S-box-containing protein